MSSIDTSFLSLLQSGVGILLALTTSLALLILGITVVQTRSRAASTWITAAGGVFLLDAILGPAAYAVLPMLLPTGETDTLLAGIAAASISLALLNTGGWALLLYGIWVLCAAPPPGR